MFSLEQKQKIAYEVEKLLLSFDHPELPTENLVFHLCVDGKKPWQCSDIEPNWIFDDDNPPRVNPWNETNATK